MVVAQDEPSHLLQWSFLLLLQVHAAVAMQSIFKPSSALSLGLSLAMASAAPPEPIGRRQDSGFSAVCTDITLKTGGWLVGTCPTGDGSSTVTSSVFLPNFISNHEASLEVCLPGSPHIESYSKLTV